MVTAPGRRMHQITDSLTACIRPCPASRPVHPSGLVLRTLFTAKQTGEMNVRTAREDK